MNLARTSSVLTAVLACAAATVPAAHASSPAPVSSASDCTITRLADSQWDAAWTDPTVWDQGRAPVSTDTVCLGSGYVSTAPAADRTVAGIVADGAYLEVAGSLSVTDTAAGIYVLNGTDAAATFTAAPTASWDLPRFVGIAVVNHGALTVPQDSTLGAQDSDVSITNTGAMTMPGTSIDDADPSGEHPATISNQPGGSITMTGGSLLPRLSNAGTISNTSTTQSVSLPGFTPQADGSLQVTVDSAGAGGFALDRWSVLAGSIDVVTAPGSSIAPDATFQVVFPDGAMCRDQCQDYDLFTGSLTSVTNGWNASYTPDGAYVTNGPLKTLTSSVPTLTGTSALYNLLTANTFSWGPAPLSLAYQWSETVAGKTTVGDLTASDSFELFTARATISVSVTGFKPGYATVTRTSAASAPVAPGTIQTDTPTITGTAKVGSTLQAHLGYWSGYTEDTIFHTQWYRQSSTGARTPIAGAVHAGYPLLAADRGFRILVKITATDPNYTTASRTSAASAIVAAGTLTTKLPTISGTTKVGSRLYAHPFTWGPGTVHLTYQWYRLSASGAPSAIKGATGSSRVLTSADRGHRLQVRVKGTKTGYTTAYRTSARTAAIR